MPTGESPSLILPGKEVFSSAPGRAQNKTSRTRDTRFVYEAMRLFLYFSSGLLYRLRCFGTENIPEEGGAVLASNHQSFLDPAFMGPSSHRQIFFLTRASAFRNPFLGPFIRCFNAFPVKRGRADLEAFRKSVEILSSGRLLMVFPEGTRSQDGTIGKMGPGVATIAQRAGSPIVPIALRGAYEAWPRHQAIPRPGRVSIAYGAPISAGRGKSGAVEAVEKLDCEIRRLYDGLAWRHSG